MKQPYIAIVALALALLFGQAASAQSHWTFPGDIYSHLANGHGQSAAGLTREQAMRLHDNLHNAAKSSRYGQRAWPNVNRAQPRKFFRRR
jgi:hypothetical protein